MLTNESVGYFWWAVQKVNYGICYVIRGKVTFFTVGKVVEVKKIEDCANMIFIPCNIPDQILLSK